ncbi:hypothetical protein QBC43DRAFT_38326 [Cladorrhinum sp. PSN259]|nr:hypothetical protein QBC43DRAFT_38326 [Cladorrhinum sp. PSN259]
MAELVLAVTGVLLPIADMILRVTQEIVTVRDDVRGASTEWEGLRNIMTTLFDQLEELRLEEESRSSRGAPMLFPTSHRDEIKQVLDRCQAFLVKHENTLTSPGAAGTLARIRWYRNPSNVKELRWFEPKVDSLYTRIVLPFLIKSRSGCSHQRQRNTTSLSDLTPSSSHSSDSIRAVEGTRSEAGIATGTSPDDIDGVRFKSFSGSVRLFLDKRLRHSEELMFDEIGIKDNNTLYLRTPTRLVRLVREAEESSDWVSVISAKALEEATLLGESTTFQEYGNRNLRPVCQPNFRFRFADIDTRRKFQQHLRGGRRILGEFGPIRIVINQVTRALSKMLQVWSGNGQSTTSITYLAAGSTTAKVDEWHLEYFWLYITSRRGGGVVELRARFPACRVERDMIITFKEKRDAQKFIDLFHAHTHQTTTPELPLSLARLSFSSSATTSAGSLPSEESSTSNGRGSWTSVSSASTGLTEPEAINGPEIRCNRSGDMDFFT